MPRKGSAYPITPQWRARVAERIEQLGISQNELARRAKVSKAALSEALNPASKQSTCVPAIHKALGWPPPQQLILAPDVLELISLYEAMPEHARGALIERARVNVETMRKKN